MKPISRSNRTAAKIAIAVLLVSATCGLAFAGWLNDGARIVMTMAETGLAWCF